MLPLCLSILVILHNSNQFGELHFHPLTSHLLCSLRSDEILKIACGVMGLQHASLHMQQEGFELYASSETEHFVSRSQERRDIVKLICVYECN